MDADLLEAICSFSPGLFQNTFWKDGHNDFSECVAVYLSSGLDLDVKVAHVVKWRERTARAGRILVDRLGEPAVPVSSSEEILLALPRMSRAPQSVAEIDRLVNRFCDGVDAAHQADDGSFLGVLAEYGRRYEVVVEVEVPLLEPSRIKIEEDVPLELERVPISLSKRRVGHWVDQEFSLGDARSAHLEARSDDSSVEIRGYEVQDLQPKDATGWLESVRVTREALAIYSSEQGRPYYVTIAVRLAVARPFIYGAYMLCMANLIAIGAVFATGFDGDVGERLAVLAIPTTVAATFVLAREQTALATRLQLVPRTVLAITTFALWLQIALGLALTTDGSLGTPGEASRPEDAAVLRRNEMPRLKQANQDAKYDGKIEGAH